MDDIGIMEDGVWQKPPGSVVSAMHCVTRPSDLRAFERIGVAYPVRTAIDLTKSGVNDRMPRWPFRMEGIDAAVRLVGSHGCPCCSGWHTQRQRQRRQRAALALC